MPWNPAQENLPIKLDPSGFRLAEKRIAKYHRVAADLSSTSERNSRIAAINQDQKYIDFKDKIAIDIRDYTVARSKVKYVGPGSEPSITEDIIMFTRTTTEGKTEFLTVNGQPISLNTALYDAIHIPEVHKTMDFILEYDGSGKPVRKIQLIENNTQQAQIPKEENPVNKYLYQMNQEPQNSAELYKEVVALIADAKLGFNLTEYLGDEAFRAKTFQSCILKMYELAGVRGKGLELVKIQVGMAVDAYRKPRSVNPNRADENCIRLLYPVLCNVREMQSDPAFAKRFGEWFQSKHDALGSRLKICYEGVVGNDSAVSAQIIKGTPVKYGGHSYIEESQTFNRPGGVTESLLVGRINLLSFPQTIKDEIGIYTKR